jgi:hypothetical protein
MYAIEACTSLVPLFRDDKYVICPVFALYPLALSAAMSGQAYGAASALCAEALAVNPLGCILVSDAVMQVGSGMPDAWCR